MNHTKYDRCKFNSLLNDVSPHFTCHGFILNINILWKHISVHVIMVYSLQYTADGMKFISWKNQNHDIDIVFLSHMGIAIPIIGLLDIVTVYENCCVLNISS